MEKTDCKTWMSKEIKNISNYVWLIMIVLLAQWASIMIIGIRIIDLLNDILGTLK